MKKLTSIGLLFVFLLSACSTPTPQATLVDTLTIRPTSIPLSEIPTATKTKKITPTRVPTHLVTPTATFEPIPTRPTILYERQPDLVKIDELLREYGFFGFSPEEPPEVVYLDSIDQTSSYVYHFKPTPELNTLPRSMVYSDLNGDGEMDLTLCMYDGVAVLLWTGKFYELTYANQALWMRSVPAEIYISFIDLTADSNYEVIYDEFTAGGGTGLWTWDNTRSIVHCEMDDCFTAWADQISAQTEDYNTGGYSLFQSDFLLLESFSGFKISQHGFQIDCCIWEIGNYMPGLRILTSSISTYEWNGIEFTLINEEIVSDGSLVSSQSTLLANNGRGDVGEITYKPNNFFGQKNEICELLINGQTTGVLFGCNHNFTTLSWQDITQDNIKDLVIIAYSAGYPADDEGNLLAEDYCMHQRLLAYTYEEGQATLIANVTGCVEDETLFGVRLQDFDGDGYPEIFAAANDTLPRRAYRWDGERFVFWSEIPE